ncbi:hypothetical protein E2C01_075013 [Portunus trituberculatus]|uniref:Uncharacterized protein n=1 Tax=Portunus trituberculatus TaxID=210409 RepID=A0A5B7IDT8_PORTR|nr:hypothetical protein [Portunus trituberculatus]
MNFALFFLSTQRRTNKRRVHTEEQIILFATTSDKHFVFKTSPSSARQPLEPRRNRTSLVRGLVIWSIQDACPAIPLSPIHLTPSSRLRRRADDGVNISARLAETLTTTMRRLAVKSG